MAKFFVNLRTLNGENPTFVEITEAAFVTLASARSILATDHGLAVYYGRGGIDPARNRNFDLSEGSEWLQYLIVPIYGVAPQNPLEPDKPFELIEFHQDAETPIDDTERARQIASRIINGIAVEGFENDADAVKALQSQLSSVANVIQGIMSE